VSACARCAGAEYFRVPSEEGFAAAQVCACRPPCARGCIDGRLFGVDASGYGFASRCACAALPQRVALYNAARLPARNVRRTIDEPPEAVGTLSAWALAREFASTYKPRAPGFLLQGGPGTSKTSLLAATLAHLTLERAVACLYVEFSQLCQRIRESIPATERSADLLAPVRRVPVLALDELGKMRGTDWEVAQLDDLISHRYQAFRTTLFATNFPLEPGDATTETLEEAIGPRLFSRIVQMSAGRLIHTGEGDLRLQRWGIS
jgi:DNA replication protein DnaC